MDRDDFVALAMLGLVVAAMATRRRRLVVGPVPSLIVRRRRPPTPAPPPVSPGVRPSVSSTVYPASWDPRVAMRM